MGPRSLDGAPVDAATDGFTSSEQDAATDAELSDAMFGTDANPPTDARVDTADGDGAGPVVDSFRELPGGNDWPRLYLFVMAYDVARSELVVLSRDGETVIWNGSSWRLVTGVVGPRMAQTAMAYDYVTRGVIVFGTAPSGSSETWRWNGSTWSRLVTAHRPNSTGLHSMAGLGEEGVLLFGGLAQGPTRSLSETWIWNGSDWIEQTTLHTPPARRAPALASDGSGNVFMYGGYHGAGRYWDAWRFSDGDWHGYDAPTPGAFVGHSLAWDPRVSAFVLFDPASRRMWQSGDTGWTFRGQLSNIANGGVGGITYDAAEQQLTLVISGDYIAYDHQPWHVTVFAY